jgi:hypothetical protein
MDEIYLWIKVVFAGFVDNADELMPSRGGIA